jgi:hypothetical protein
MAAIKTALNMSWDSPDVETQPRKSRNLPASPIDKHLGQMGNLGFVRLLHCKVNPGGTGVKVQTGIVGMIKNVG